jgi:hypothetical protein
MTFQSNTRSVRPARNSRIAALSLCAMFTAEASALSLPQRIFHLQPEPEQHFAGAPCNSFYLAKVGAVPLRFAALPPEAVESPTPSQSPSVPMLPTPGGEAAAANPPPVKTADPISAGKTPESPAKLLSILPDDTPRDVRADEVIPYFQLPHQNERPSVAGMNLPFTPAQPAASTLPPSSATYQQK